MSSTARDLDEYRAAVQDVLLKRVEVAAYLSEDWSGGLDDTVERCRERLKRADAYFGIFAYWYGSVPPGQDESITHTEFRWAMERWGELPAPPVAVFMPEGEADEALRIMAEKLFIIDHGHLTEAERDTLRERIAGQLAAFHGSVRSAGGRWRTVNPFSDAAELRERAIVTCLRWQQELPPQLNGRTPTDEELGRLGRDAQVTATRKALSRATSRGDAPGVALLVTGCEDAGQREFCSYLLTLPQLRRGRAARGRPLSERYDLSVFVAWCAQTLGLARPASETAVEAVEELAARIHDALKRQQLTLVLDQLDRFPGKVTGFHERFWKPIFAALQARPPTPHRLVVVAAEHTGKPSQWVGRSGPPEDDIDYGLLVELPQLADLVFDDVRRWLDEMEVLDEPCGRCNELTEIALKSPGGERDGTPRRVFARLRNESLWPDEEA